MLRKNFFNASQVIDIVKDFHHAGLTDEEVAIMAFAQKITAEAGSIRKIDVDELRGFGLTDEEVLDVVLACTARIFFSKTLDALDAQPDETFVNLEPELVKVLTIGRAYP
ncbi:MAG TPA: hypothetical protein VLD65_10110 [Anaerolineales bacterium]|nr:hypothetical protein [Anaerolineales bacterium]